jgi:hypothetical protein
VCGVSGVAATGGSRRQDCDGAAEDELSLLWARVFFTGSDRALNDAHVVEVEEPPPF